MHKCQFFIGIIVDACTYNLTNLISGLRLVHFVVDTEIECC